MNYLEKAINKILIILTTLGHKQIHLLFEIEITCHYCTNVLISAIFNYRDI